MHLQFTRRLGLQLADGDQRSERTVVSDRRIGESGRCHVRASVQGATMGVSRSSLRPSRRRRAHRSAGRTRNASALVHLVDDRHGSCRTAAWPIRLARIRRWCPARGLLHHSMDGDLRGGRQFHDRGSLLRPPRVASHPCYEHQPDRHRLPDFIRGFRCAGCKRSTRDGFGAITAGMAAAGSPGDLECLVAVPIGPPVLSWPPPDQ